MPAIALLGTLDTKLHELLYLHRCLISHGALDIYLIDVGRTPTTHDAVTHSLSTVLSHHPTHSPPPTPSSIQSLSRNELTALLIPAATDLITDLFHNGKISALVSAGGSTGTSLATAVMRKALPIGFPKIMLSTIASGDMGPLVGEADVTMMYSVVDIAGRNWVLDAMCENVAGAAVGMATAWEARREREKVEQKRIDDRGRSEGAKMKIRVGISMFGVTTPCVDRIRELLAKLSASSSHPNEYETLVFQSTGHGGLALERLVASSQIDAVIDVTLTEIADHVVGGVMSAGPDRLLCGLARGIPIVLSVGACDMVNFGPRATVPEKYAQKSTGRKLYEHNPSVTLMRTNGEECEKVADFVVDKLRRECERPASVKVLLPVRGVSAISGPGGAFEDREADEALFKRLENGLEGSGVEILRSDCGINDDAFAEQVVDLFEKVML